MANFLNRIFRSNKIFPRKLRFTREGKVIVLLSLGLGFAAINTGNNLLYLSFSLLLCLIITSGILSEQTLRKITVEKISNPVFFAGSSTSVFLKITSKKNRFISRSLEAAPLFDEKGIQITPGFCLSLEPNNSKQVSMKLIFPHRGEFKTTELRLSTRFPFSFFRKSIYLEQKDTYLVYPAMVQVNEFKIEKYASGVEQSFTGIGRGNEFYGVREKHAGDDLNSIHWKLSAKKDRLIAREFQALSEKRIIVSLFNFVKQDNMVQNEIMEQSISYTASVCHMFIKRGYSVGLRTLFEFIEPNSGAGHIHTILGVLAKLEVITSDIKGIASLIGADKMTKLTGNYDHILILPSFQEKMSFPDIFGKNILRVEGIWEKLASELVSETHREAKNLNAI